MKKTLLFLLALNCAIMLQAQNELDFIEEARQNLSVPMLGVVGGPGGNGNGVVGAIGGVVDVGGLGAATYTIPLELPEGIGGVQPSLSVTYNSQSGNGLLGWGWTLGGLSAISRVGKNLFLDGGIKGVNFNNDCFALDGQRLIETGGTYWSSGIEYRTEVDGMSRIVSYTEDSIVHGPAKFKVWTSNGFIMEYGYTPDSKIAYKCKNDTTKYEVALWLLNKVQDRDGNYMKYEYGKGEAHYCVKKISYTGNADAGFYPRYLIIFDYGNNPEARRDTETTFIGNHTLHQARLLESISIQWCVYNPWSFEEIARYDFDYLDEDAQQGLYYHRLDGITYSKDGIQYNKTTVDWGNNDYSTNPANFITAVTTGNGNAFANKVKFTGDFNGDGFKDILVVYKNSSRKYAAVYLNDGIINGNSSFHFHQEIELDTYTESIHVADLDGDGRDDMVTVSREPVFLKKKVKIFPFLTKWLGQDWMLDYAEKLWTEDDLYISSGHAANLMLGDFLGNGKTEMVMQIPDGSLVHPQLLYITYLGNNQFSMTRSYSQLMYGSVFTAADFNGDGITEIWCDGQVNKNNADETGAPERANAAMYKMTSHYNVTQFNTDYVLSNNHHLLLGDFNGDGKCDMLSYVEESKNADSTRTSYRWKINYFMESELFWNAFDITDELPYIDPERHSFGLFDSPWDHTDYQYYEVTDMDGDGKSDFVVQSGNYLYIYFGPLIKTGIESARFSYKKILNLYDIGLGSIVSKMTLCAGSFLGRENAGIMGNSSIFSLFPMTNRYSVSTITDGMGNKTEFEYDYLTTFNSDIYSWSKSFDEPEYDIFSVPFSMKALKKVSSSNPIASTPVTSTKYHYRDAYVHRKGKGVLGFRLTASASYINGQRFDSVVSSYSTVPLRAHRALAFDHRWMYNAMNRLTLQEDYTNGFMEYHSNSHVYVPLVKIKHASSFNPDNNMEELLSVAITENEYQIDFAAGNNGGLGYYSNTLKLTDTYEGMSEWWYPYATDCPYVTHTETFYRTENHQDTWIINRPDSTVVTSWKTGDPFISKSLITYSYRDNTTYHPSKIKSYPGGNLNNANGLATMTAYEYDAVGNVTSETLAALSGTPLGRTTSYTYQDHRLRATETNALGYVTQSHYDPKYGEILYGADCNGQTTYYNHSDHLGSSEWVRYPDMTYGCTAKRWARHRMSFYDPDSPSQAAYYMWKRISGEAPVKAFYDAAGREMRTVTYGLHGDTIYQDTEYNSLGLVLRKSLPYFKSDTRQWTSYYYDGLLRLQATYQPDGTYTTVEYSGLSTTTTFHTTDQTTRTSRVTNNYLGQKIRSVDAFGTEVTYVYYPDGKLKYTQVGNNTDTRINLEYDDAGNRTKIYDPNYGEVVETYDAFGQLLSTRSPKNDMTTYQYDVLGRCISRLETDNAHLTSVQTSWTYSETTGQKGLLQQISYGNNQEIIYNYDATHLNRLISMKERLFGDDYMTYYTYDDSDGFPLRVHSVTYPTGYATCNVYDLASGQHYKIEDGQNNTLWETLEMNALGQVTRYSLGNGVMSHRSFDPNTGRLHGIGSSNGQINLQNLGYEWDDFGNLAARYDKTKDLMETFGYDALDRLTDISLNDVPTGHMTYDIFGRMTSKQADGQAVFSSAQYDFVGLDGQLRPHAVSSAEMVSNPFPTQGLGLDYTMFDKVLQITWPSNNSIQFDYGYDHQRIRSLTSHGLSPITKTYIGNCEKIHTAPVSDVYRTYLSGPLGVFAVVEQVANTESITYILKDHLGSWTVFTDEDGDLVREESFDAWGNRRNAATWTGAAIGDLLFDRGFTGHEHIENIGLINMNGRLYDPVMSTFLSVDNYVQEPDFSQNFNRYAYCLNNPLKYVDPDGESITLLTAIAISAAVSMVSTVATNIVYDRPLYEGLGKAAVVGALQGVFSFGIGTAAGIIGKAVEGVTNATWGMVAQAGFQVLAHGTLGGISTEARGGKFWHGFASGAVASFVASTTGIMTDKLPKAWQVTCMVAAGGLSGGVTATMAGGYFWDGVCNGLICSGLNHAMHLACETMEGPDDPPQQESKQQNNGFKRLIGKKFFWELNSHYLAGEGEDVFLTKEQFTELIIHGKIDYVNAELGEDGYYTTSISFYETNDDLHYSFGTASVKYKILDDNKFIFSGFKDTYNFDPKPWGVRSFKNEVITRTYNKISNGTDFSIYYNKKIF